METREVTQYKVFVLHLEGISSGAARPVAVFRELVNLFDFYNSGLESKEWIDNAAFDMAGNSLSVTKYFKKGSLLENFAPLILEDGKRELGYDYEVSTESTPDVPGIYEQWVTGYPGQEMFLVPFEPGNIDDDEIVSN